MADTYCAEAGQRFYIGIRRNKMKTVTRTVLIADEGMMLTDGESYGKAAYLKVDGDPSKWREITEEEYFASEGAL